MKKNFQNLKSYPKTLGDILAYFLQVFFFFFHRVCYALKTYSYLIPSICKNELFLAIKL